MSTANNLASTPIKRSVGNTIGFVVGILMGLALAYWAWSSNHPIVAGIIGLVCLGLLVMVLKGSGVGEAPCPSCGKPLDGLGNKPNERCIWCFAYSEPRDGRLWQVEESRVETRPEFVIPLPENLRMPPICCACGEPATRAGSMVANYNIQHNVLPVARGSEYSLQIPYCNSHDSGGAETATTVMGIEGKISMQEMPALKVKSHRFYREFLRLNGIAGNPSQRISW